MTRQPNPNPNLFLFKLQHNNVLDIAEKQFAFKKQFINTPWLANNYPSILGAIKP